MARRAAVAILLPVACAFMDGTEQPAPGTGADTDMTIVKLDGSATGAVCLDGTHPAYYIRAGTGSGARKWRIHHQGGGWCEGYPDCTARSKTDLGSSKACLGLASCSVQPSSYCSTSILGGSQGLALSHLFTRMIHSAC